MCEALEPLLGIRRMRDTHTPIDTVAWVSVPLSYRYLTRSVIVPNERESCHVAAA